MDSSRNGFGSKRIDSVASHYFHARHQSGFINRLQRDERFDDECLLSYSVV